MKKAKIAVIALMMAGGVITSNAQDKNIIPDSPIAVESVGPAVAGSVNDASLPKRAHHFIDKVGGEIMSVEKEFATGEYDVRLTNGIEIEFNKSGNVIEIDAPDDQLLSTEVIKAAVPYNLYHSLKKMSLDTEVSSISYNGDQYSVDLEGMYDEALYSSDGTLVALYCE